METLTAIGLWFAILVVIAIPTLIVVVGLYDGHNTESVLSLALILVICVYALIGSFIITGFYYHPEEYGYYKMEMED